MESRTSIASWFTRRNIFGVCSYIYGSIQFDSSVSLRDVYVKILIQEQLLGITPTKDLSNFFFSIYRLLQSLRGLLRSKNSRAVTSLYSSTLAAAPYCDPKPTPAQETRPPSMCLSPYTRYLRCSIFYSSRNNCDDSRTLYDTYSDRFALWSQRSRCRYKELLNFSSSQTPRQPATASLIHTIRKWRKRLLYSTPSSYSATHSFDFSFANIQTWSRRSNKIIPTAPKPRIEESTKPTQAQQSDHIFQHHRI